MPKRRGFTLIELLVVISIIGLLATLMMANLTSARGRARDAQRKSDLKNIATALRLYYNDRGSYPAASGGKIIACNSYSIPVACNWGSTWIVSSTTYMQTLPKDPLSAQYYKYTADSANDTFTLESCLENKSDDKGVVASDITWCPSGWEYKYKQ